MLISSLQNNLEEPEWDSENKDELEGDSETKGEENDKGIRFFRGIDN